MIVSGWISGASRRLGVTAVLVAGFVSTMFAAPDGLAAQTGDVTLRVDYAPNTAHRRAAPAPSPAVAWLVPVDAPVAKPAETRTFRMVQKNKRFDPHLMVVPVGSYVEFPNLDPFFHNVFSLYNGKRFDLGLYETGSERGVRFDREGVSYIFCNIHPEMGAVILALATPYYAVSHDGVITIPHVPAGRYTLNVWSEGATADSLSQARRVAMITSSGANLGSITLSAAPSPAHHHANKFGDSYPPAATSDSEGSPY